MYMEGKKIMPPPWLAYPHIEKASIGWRMGYGEDYSFRFFDWLNRLTQGEREEYRRLFPEPITWSGWWEREDAGDELRRSGLRLHLWRPQGAPKYTRTWLMQKASEDMSHDMCLFWRHHPTGDGKLAESCLSQWWMQEFCYSVTKYCCMEQFMMEQKAKLFEDEAKYSIVLNGNWRKFSQNRDLREFLLSTGDSVLAEASPYDGIWGIRLAADAEDARNPLKWKGDNLLGFALMEVRDELRRVTQNEGLCDWSVVEE